MPGSFETVNKQEDEGSRQQTLHREQLEELTHQNSLLKRELEDAVNVLRNDKSMLSEENKSKDKKIQRLENDIANLQRERQHLMHESNAEWANIKQQLRMRNQQLGDARSENKLLKASLEECKDRIFSMQPAQGLSDIQLQNAYTDLCNSIEYWVEEQFDEVENVIRSIVHAGTRGDDPHVVWDHITQPDYDAVKLEPELNNALLVALLSQHLYSQFLAPERVYPGLPDTTESCLRDIIHGITNLHPSKGKQKFCAVDVSLTKQQTWSSFRAGESIFTKHWARWIRQGKGGNMHCKLPQPSLKAHSYR